MTLVNDVAMGSPLGPRMANAFLCSTEEKLERENTLPEFYKRYIDDTLAIMPNVPAAAPFLSKLHDCHPSLQFTMEIVHVCRYDDKEKRLPPDNKRLMKCTSFYHLKTRNLLTRFKNN